MQKSVVGALGVLMSVIAINCSSQEETTTSGKMNIVCDESVAPLLNIQIKEFMRIWKSAEFTSEAELTRRAVERFANKETRFIVLSRTLKPDEEQALREAEVSYAQKPIAYDAVCFIVNPKNPVGKLKLEQLRDILTGKIANWERVGGKKQPIQLFLMSRNDGQRDFLKDSLLRADDFPSGAYPCSTAAQMKELVLKYEGALGYAGMAHVRKFLDPNERDSSAYKVLAIAPEGDSTYYLPMQEHVYKHRYPLVNTVYYLYLKTDKLPLGFAAFLSKEGQKVFQRNGAAPFEPPMWVINFKAD
ncbi:MAG: substrate-binding domain-containing protein [Chloroherpetonaceae bacterium]|nr:substrate-binding domain-containing protein [Chloroherpetonaceae bacterium]MDW8437532.1 substrate-binding domain-containing protein [Chloroherpetonaceae bacterium]